MKITMKMPYKSQIVMNMGIITLLIASELLLSYLFMEHTSNTAFTLKCIYVSAFSIIIAILSGHILNLNKANKASEKNEQLYWSLMERFPEAVVVHCKGEIVFINRKGLTMLGARNKSQVLRQPVTKFLQTAQASQFKDNPVFFTMDKHLQFKINCLNGKTKDIEITNIPVRMKGRVATLVVARDLTKQKFQEKRLWDTNEKLQAIINSCPLSITALDLNGNVKLWNPAAEKMYGWKQEEILNEKIPSVPESVPHAEIIKLIKSGPHVGIETKRKRKDGFLLDVRLSTAPMKDIDGNLIGSMGIMVDITDIKKTEQLLRKTEKLSSVGELAAGVAHEIRNPLTAVKGFIQLMSKQEHNEYFEVMLSEINRIEDIIHEMLVLAKPHAVHFEKTNLKETINQVAALCTSQAILNNIELNVKVEPGLPDLYCEENQMKQAFINLLKNSMEAMPNGGIINVTARQEDNKLIIRFADQGCGIKKQNIPKLGEPFYTTKADGTGLGLMRCYKVVENHKGSMSIDSELGKGTTITLMLPIAVQHKTVS